MESQEWMSLAILSIVLIGCSGNVVSFTIFSRPHMRSSSVNVLLSFLSFVDFSLLLLASLTFAIPGLLSDEGAYRKLMAYVLNYVYPVNLTMQTCSIWTMVMITTERWFAVCRPLQVRIWCTPRKSRMAILIIFISSIAYNFVRFFEYSIGYDETGNITYERHLRDPSAYPLYTVGYFTVSYLVTHFLLPFTILAIFNGHVIVTMWRMRKARLALTRQQQREQSTTVMLLVVTFLFAASNTLPFLLNVAECVFPNLFIDERTASTAYHINDLANLLVVLNSATTLLIYLSFSEKYRETLVFILRNGCCASSGEYTTYVAMSRTASMRCPSTHNSSFTHGHKLSVSRSGEIPEKRSSDAFLKPLCNQKRADRSTSEYNERTKKKEFHLLKKNGGSARKPYSTTDRPFVPEITVTETCESPSKDHLQVVHL